MDFSGFGSAPMRATTKCNSFHFVVAFYYTYTNCSIKKMDSQDKNLDKSLSEFDKFAEFAKKILAVSKTEVQTKPIRVVKQKPAKP